MASVYVIIENGIPYSNAYHTYAAAVTVANEKHSEELNRQIAASPEDKDEILANMNPKEGAGGETELFMEFQKDIRIMIHRLPVVARGGTRRSSRNRSSRNRSRSRSSRNRSRRSHRNDRRFA
jgi:hypothetical protein